MGVRQVREIQRLDAKKKELERKQNMDKTRVQKIFENQERLRENIKSMEHVRTGTLLDRYMNDMDKEENDLIEARRRIEDAEENMVAISNDVSKLCLQVSLKAKQTQVKFEC